MIELPVSRPSNRFVVRERDRRWLRALAATLLVAAVLGAVLFLVGWPRLQATSINYRLIRLRGEVQELERRERDLAVRLEQERNPAVLGRRARALGLQPPAPGQIAASPPAGRGR